MGIRGFFFLSFFLSFLSNRAIANGTVTLSLVFRERTSGARVTDNGNRTEWSPIDNGNRTEWSPIRSVIVRVMNKIRRPRSGSRFVNHDYDYRPNCTTRSPVYQLVIPVAISERINA